MDRFSRNRELLRGKNKQFTYLPEDPLATRVDESLIESDPVDLASVRHDDIMLDRIATGDIDVLDYPADRELIEVLSAWRRDVDQEPYAGIVDIDAAVAAIRVGRAKSRRSRFLVPFASAAAVLAIAFTGASLLAKDAKPGDPLWGLTQVLYVDHAHSVEAAALVQSDLSSAQSALSQGKVEAARSALANAQTALPAVASEDGRAALASAHESLVQQLNTQSPLPSKGTSTSGTTTATTTTPSTPTSTTTPVTSTPTTTPSGAQTSTEPPSSTSSATEGSSPRSGSKSTSVTPSSN